MSVWKKSTENSKEIKKSEELCKERDKLISKWSAIQKEWEDLDKVVLEAAGGLAVAQYTSNPDRILQAKEKLKLAISERDGLKNDYSRKVEKLNGAIEELNSETINEKAAEWRKSLTSLPEKKIISKISTRETIDLKSCLPGRMITYKSNFGIVLGAKTKLIGAVSELRGMRQSSLADLLSFIKKMEAEFLGIDFSVLTESEEVTERMFEELYSQPEVKIYTTAHMEGNRIVKDYNLPVKEFK